MSNEQKSNEEKQKLNIPKEYIRLEGIKVVQNREYDPTRGTLFVKMSGQTFGIDFRKNTPSSYFSQRLRELAQEIDDYERS